MGSRPRAGAAPANVRTSRLADQERPPERDHARTRMNTAQLPLSDAHVYVYMLAAGSLRVRMQSGHPSEIHRGWRVPRRGGLTAAEAPANVSSECMCKLMVV